jgi:hypothetical protein
MTTCAGPVYFADQGIEVCETCGGCICCDFASVDHAAAERRCLTDEAGRCALRAHAGHDCKPEERAMSVRCKFKLVSIESHAGGNRTFKFEPQYDQSIPEDQRFQKYTPSGLFTMYVDNPAIQLALGDQFYFDITPVPA